MKSCPTCREALTAATFDGITLDGCHRCGGVWFDRGELTRMARGDVSRLAAVDRAFGAQSSAAAPVSGSPEVGTGLCPQCAGNLIEFEPPQAAGLRLLGCAAGHGVWVREAEFEAIIQRVQEWRAQHRGTAPAAAPKAEERARHLAHLLLSRPCPRCKEPNASASPVCWACGAVLPGTQAFFRCAGCGGALDAIFHEGVTLNHCGNCGGLWLDRGELGELIDLPRAALLRLQDRLRLEKPTSTGGPTTALLCPACAGDVDPHEYAMGSGVMIHSCRGCGGVWIDPSVLVAIHDFVKKDESFIPPAEGV